MANYFTFVDTNRLSITGAPLPTGTPTTTETWTNFDCLTSKSYTTAADGQRSTIELTPSNCPSDGFTTVYIYAQPSTIVYTYHYEQSSGTSEAPPIVPITSTVFATPTDAAEKPATTQPYVRTSNNRVGFIVGITFGCIVAAVVLLLAVRACWRWRRKSKLNKAGLVATRPAEKGMGGLRQFYNPAAVPAVGNSMVQKPTEFYAPVAGGAGDGCHGSQSAIGTQSRTRAVVQAGPSKRRSVGSPVLPSTAEVEEEDSDLYEVPRAVGGTEGKGKEPVRWPPSQTPQVPSLAPDPNEIRSVGDAGGRVV